MFIYSVTAQSYDETEKNELMIGSFPYDYRSVPGVIWSKFRQHPTVIFSSLCTNCSCFNSPHLPISYHLCPFGHPAKHGWHEEATVFHLLPPATPLLLPYQLSFIVFFAFPPLCWPASSNKVGGFVGHFVQVLSPFNATSLVAGLLIGLPCFSSLSPP